MGTLLIRIFFVAAFTFPVMETQKTATLDLHVDFGGSQTVVTIPTSKCDCVNIVAEHQDDTSSVKTEDCIRLWDGLDCTGKYVDVNPPDDASNVVDTFNDMASSYSNCQYAGPCPTPKPTAKPGGKKGKGKKIKKVITKKKKIIVKKTQHVVAG